MTLDEFYDKLSTLPGLGWKVMITGGGNMRMFTGEDMPRYCPITAVIKQQCGVSYGENEVWLAAKQELGMYSIDTEVIVKAADDYGDGSVRDKMLKALGITDDD